MDSLTWLAVSTHPGEYEDIHTAHRILKEKYPNAKLIIAPRHPPTFQASKFLFVHDPSVRFNEALGTMDSSFHAADLAFIGGTFVESVGGHNVLEPISKQIPCMVGPFTDKIDDLIEACGSVVRVKNGKELGFRLIELFENESLRKQIADTGYQNYLRTQEDVLDTYLDLITPMIDRQRPKETSSSSIGFLQALQYALSDWILWIPSWTRIRNHFFPGMSLWKDYRYWRIRFHLYRERRACLPLDKASWVELSSEYQAARRFERDKALMKEAQKRFPEWEYPLKRLEQYAKPLFHPEPSFSQVIPAKPKTASNDLPEPGLTIVTGMSSNAPYFELGFQLIESIQATQLYCRIPIKVLDCGLNEPDRQTLKDYFDIEIKDPGWDIDPQLIVQNPARICQWNGWKGCTARPHLHEHFPGYDYYIWMDADSWVRDETGLCELISRAKEQGVGCFTEYPMKKIRQHDFFKALIPEFASQIEEKPICYNGLFCASRAFLANYAKLTAQNTQISQRYVWGTDMALFTFTAHSRHEPLKSLGCRYALRSQHQEKIVQLEFTRKFQRYESFFLNRLPNTLNALDREDILSGYRRFYKEDFLQEQLSYRTFDVNAVNSDPREPGRPSLQQSESLEAPHKDRDDRLSPWISWPPV